MNDEARKAMAAREAVLAEAVIELRDIANTVHANGYGSGGFRSEAYRRILHADAALADTSPAAPDGRTRAATLLAQGELVEWLREYHLAQAHTTKIERYVQKRAQDGLVDGCEACERFRAALALPCGTCEGRGFIVGVLPSEPPCPDCAPGEEKE